MSAPQFAFKKATRSQAKARVAIAGPAGSGKTWTALVLATALCQRVALIDTEHGSASKYAGDFAFDVLELGDFHPDNYAQAIRAAQAAGYDGLVIDSASHEWSGRNGCLELVDVFARRNKGGNQWAAWADVTPLHNHFIEAIHAAPLHVFATFRSKMDYIQTESNGRKEIKKVGMAAITREGAEYEFDVVGEMDLDHNMVITKSRCQALADRVIAKPGRELAEELHAWLSDGAKAPQPASTAAAPKPTEPSPTPSAPARPTNGKAEHGRALIAWDSLRAEATELQIDLPSYTAETPLDQIVKAGRQWRELLRVAKNNQAFREALCEWDSQATIAGDLGLTVPELPEQVTVPALAIAANHLVAAIGAENERRAQAAPTEPDGLPFFDDSRR